MNRNSLLWGWCACVALVCSSLGGCAQTIGDEGASLAGPTSDGGVGVDAGDARLFGGLDGTALGPGATCAGTTCGRGLDCCLVTGRCFDPRRPGDCAPPPTDAGYTTSMGDPGARACTSNSGCAPTEFCHVANRLYQGCLGVGVCELRSAAGSCGPIGSPDCQVCGCDGVTYAWAGDAQRAGVGYHSGPCGIAATIPDAGPDGAAVVFHAPCGSGSACPNGEVCCSITGQCHDPSCTSCCRMPPLGTAGPCGSDSDCPSRAPFCEGGPACDAPGFCVGPPRDCTGALSPACGCDGVTYVNECQARRALQRVAYLGACRDR